MRALWRSALSSTAALSISIGTSPFSKWNMCPLLALMSLFTFCHIEIFVALYGKKEKKRTGKATVGFFHLGSHLWAGLPSLSPAAALLRCESHTFLPWEMHTGGEIHQGMKSVVVLQGTKQCGWKHTWNPYGAQWQLLHSKEIEVLSLFTFLLQEKRSECKKQVFCKSTHLALSKTWVSIRENRLVGPRSPSIAWEELPSTRPSIITSTHHYFPALGA